MVNPVVQRRHEAAMRIVKSLEAKDRLLLLSYVVWGSAAIREHEARQEDEEIRPVALAS